MTRPDSSEASDAPHGAVGDLAAIFAQAGQVSTVFGAPVAQEGITVVPVARVRWGAGGGGSGGGGKGGGLGGGLTVAPVGYVVLRGGEAEYRPIPAPLKPLALLAAVAIGVFLARRR